MKDTTHPKTTPKTDKEILAMIEQSQKTLTQSEKEIDELMSKIDTLAKEIEDADIETKLKAVTKEGSERLDRDFASLVDDLQKIGIETKS